MALRIQMLGEFVVHQNGILIKDWESDKTKATLKFLIAKRNQICLNEQIIEHIWPDNDFDQKKSMNLLRGRIYNARRALELGEKPSERFVETCHGGYRFNAADCLIDIDEFNAHFAQAQTLYQQEKHAAAAPLYERALDWYRGDFLEEDVYADWTEEFRQSYRLVYINALHHLAECHARLGRYRQAIALCERALQHAPLEEDILRKAMIYNVRRNARNQAEHLYLAFLDTLKRLFPDDVRQPDPKTRQLYDQIRSEEELDFESYPEYEDEIIPVFSLERLPLIGRQQEYGQLLHHLNQTFQGHGRLVLIGGETGVGKTRLAEQIIQFATQSRAPKAQQGRFERLRGKFGLIKGANSEVSAQSPYLALFNALRIILPQQDATALQLSPLSRSVLSQWLYGLEAVLGDCDPPVQLPPQQERLRLFETLRQLLFELSRLRAPLLLFLDDLQWADTSTIDWLDYLLPHLMQHPLIVVGTYRSEELKIDSALAGLARRAMRANEGQGVYHLSLDRFTREAIQQLLDEKGQRIEQKDELGAFLYEESQGNALVLVEILSVLFQENALTVTASEQWALAVHDFQQVFRGLIPEKIRDIFIQRILQLPTAQRVLLELASVINQRCPKDLLEHLWRNLLEKTHGGLGPTLTQAIQSRFLTTEGSVYGLSHDKFREVVYQNIADGLRQRLHHQVAESLQDHHWMPLSSHGILAYHYDQADMPRETLTHLIPAIQEAVSGYRNVQALKLIENANTQLGNLADRKVEPEELKTTQFELLVEHIKVLDILGETEQHRQLLHELLEIVDELDDSEKKIDTYLLLSQYHQKLGDYPEALSQSYKALQLATENKNLLQQGRAFHEIALYHWNIGDFEGALDYLDREIDIQKNTMDEKALSETLYYLGKVYWWKGQYEKAEKYYKEALEVQENIKETQIKFMILRSQGSMYWSKNDYQKAIKSYKSVRELASQIGDKRGEAQALGNIGLAHWSLGDYELAKEEIHQAEKIHAGIKDKRGQGLDLNNLGLVYCSLGKFEKASQLYQSALELFSEIQWNVGQALVQAGFAQIHRHNKEFDRAIELCQHSIKTLQETDSQWQKGSALHHLGQIYLDLKAYDQALDCLNQALAIKRALNSKEEEMLILSDQGIVYLNLNKLDQALSYSQEAVRLLEERGATPQAPQVWLNHFYVLEANDLATEATDALSNAYASLMIYLRKINDEGLRASFGGIPLHRTIWKTHTQHQATDKGAEAALYALLRKVRWEEDVACPHCGSKTIHKKRTASVTSRRYQCEACNEAFNDRTGTVFEHSKLPLGKLYQGLLFIHEHIASTPPALAELIDVQSQTARNLYPLLQTALEEDGVVQVLLPHLD